MRNEHDVHSRYYVQCESAASVDNRSPYPGRPRDYGTTLYKSPFQVRTVCYDTR